MAMIYLVTISSTGCVCFSHKLLLISFSHSPVHRCRSFANNDWHSISRDRLQRAALHTSQIQLFNASICTAR